MPQVLRRPRDFGVRIYVGGFLYLEGIIVLLLGSILLFGYWPPVETVEESQNPVSMVGMVICGVAVTYMISVGLGMFLYNLFRPSAEEPVHPVQQRAWRYAQIKSRSDYLFDDELGCEADAEEAFVARQII